jgi:hypothetical protein
MSVFPQGNCISLYAGQLATPPTEGYGSCRIHLHFCLRAVTRIRGGEKKSKGLACQEPHTYRVKKKIGFAQPRLRGGAFFCLFGFAHAAICSLCLDNAGRGLGQHPSGLQCWWSRIAGLPCDARAEVVSGNSLRGLCPLRSNSPGKHDDDACFARPPRHCASQHQQGALPDADPALFPPCWWHATAPQRRHATSGVTRADAAQTKRSKSSVSTSKSQNTNPASPAA